MLITPLSLYTRLKSWMCDIYFKEKTLIWYPHFNVFLRLFSSLVPHIRRMNEAYSARSRWTCPVPFANMGYIALLRSYLWRTSGTLLGFSRSPYEHCIKIRAFFLFGIRTPLFLMCRHPVQRLYRRFRVSGFSLTRGICITKCVPCLRKQSSKIIDFYNSIQRKSSKMNTHATGGTGFWT